MRHSSTPPLALLLMLRDELCDIYGTYCETRSAVTEWKKVLAASVPQDISRQWTRLYFGRTGPSGPYQHSRLITEMAERLGEDGPNVTRLQEGAVVLSYAIWEHGFRPTLSDRSGVTIESDIFGDMKHYRHAIAHNHGTLDRRTKVLDFIAVGSPVRFTENQFYELFALMIEEVNAIGTRYFGHNPRYSLDQMDAGSQNPG